MTEGERTTPLRNTVVLIAGLLLVWELAYLAVGDVALRSPLQTLRFTANLVQTEFFWVNLVNTMEAFAFALLIAVGLGLAIGFVLGLHRLSAEAMEPMLVALYSIPKLTLYPIMLLAFGLGMSAKVAFGVIHGMIPVMLFTMAAVKNLQPVLLRTARVLRLSPTQTAFSVLAPAVTPEIITGLRVGFALTLLGVLIGEMFASQRGLGFLIINGIAVHDVRMTTTVTLIVVVFAVAANGLMLALDRRAHHVA